MCSTHRMEQRRKALSSEQGKTVSLQKLRRPSVSGDETLSFLQPFLPHLLTCECYSPRHNAPSLGLASPIVATMERYVFYPGKVCLFFSTIEITNGDLLSSNEAQTPIAGIPMIVTSLYAIGKNPSTRFQIDKS